MDISILVTSKDHPVNGYIQKWLLQKSGEHLITVAHSKEELKSGDILFLISCSEIIPKLVREKYKKTLVIHASDLPFGRGWSPHVWEILNGADNLTLSLLEAEDKVDTGDIWKKVNIPISKTALFDEINALIFNLELELMDFAIENFNAIDPVKQSNINSTYWPRRLPKDSEVDIYKTILEQFDLMRVCDPLRFPAYFYKDGVRFDITISKHVSPSLKVDVVILRKANASDMRQYYDWINDIAVRKNSFSGDLISWEDHQRWFKQKLINQQCFLYVAQIDRINIGQVRIDYETDNVASIHFLVGKEFRGLGLSKKMLIAALDNIKKDCPKVKKIEYN